MSFNLICLKRCVVVLFALFVTAGWVHATSPQSPAPIVFYNTIGYDLYYQLGADYTRFSSPMASVMSEWEKHNKTTCSPNPGYEFRWEFDRLTNTDTGSPEYDGWFISWANIYYCPTQELWGNTTWGSGTRRYVWCAPGKHWYAYQAMPTPGVCAAADLPPEKNYGPPPCPNCEGNPVGNPINTALGNKYQQQTEYRGSGPFPLVFGWTYNSLVPVGLSDMTTETLGANRTHSYMRKILLTSSPALTTAWVLRPDGKTYYFGLTGTNTWQPDADIADRLIRQVDASNNTLGWQYITQSDESTENYDANGRLTSIVSRSGLTHTLAYDATGNLVSITDDFGRSIGLVYSSTTGRITALIDPDGHSTLFTYDTNRMLTGVQYPDGAVKTYLHEMQFVGTNHFLTGIVDENNARYATFAYDVNGRAASTEHAGGVEKYTVNYSGQTSSITDPLNVSRPVQFSYALGVARPAGVSQPCGTPGCSGTVNTTYAYDANGNVSQRTDYKGNVTTYVYDLTRNLETSRTEGYGTAAARTITTTWNTTYRLPAAITEPVAGGNKVSTFTYDAAGNLTQKVVATPQGSRTWSWTYDAYGRVLTATDPRNNTSTNTYYPNLPAQGVKRGMLATVTNAAGHTTTITSYNAHGQPLSITDANGLVSTMVYDTRQRLTSRTVGSETTTYLYDAVGQLTKSSYLQYTYDAAHRLVQIQDGLGNRIAYTLDNMGNRLKEDAIDPTNALARTRSRVYDSLNRLKQDIGGADPANQITQYAYDDAGNLTGTTDPLSRVTGNSYDALNRLTQVTDPASGLTKYEYDAQDNLTKVTDPKNLDTTYSYNGFNEMVTQVSPDTGTTTFAYDAGGNLATKTDARNVTATYSYDNLNRVTLISYPDEMVGYTYDSCTNGIGRLCVLTDRTGSTAFSYDLRGRITGKSQTVNSLTQSIAYSYNAAGQLASVTYPSGAVIAYSYLNNRITGITINGITVLNNAEYEPFGPVGEWAWGNGTPQVANKHVRYFDLDGRNTKIESLVGLDPSVIVYDAASRITALQKLTNNVVDPAKSISYGYDNLDRLTTVTPGAGNPVASQSYTYDSVGNRLSNTVAGSTTNYGYGTSSHRLNTLTGAVAKSYSYDAVGNRTNDGNQLWVYGGNNRPTSITLTSPSTTVLSGINALGQRVTKSVNGTTTRFVYDEAGRLIGEYNDTGGRLTETVWFNDLPVAVMK